MLVHPQDHPLLAIQWQDSVYVDTALPFKLWSAPKVFNALADALQWHVKQDGIQYLWHNLNDFITVGQAGTGECDFNNKVLHHVCKRLGVPLAADKCDGPTTHLTFLGIKIDSWAMELRLPREKLKGEIAGWQSKWSCTKRKLQSVTGLLQHAVTVVHQGCTFIQRLYDLLSVSRAHHHHIRLNVEACLDLA